MPLIILAIVFFIIWILYMISATYGLTKINSEKLDKILELLQQKDINNNDTL